MLLLACLVLSSAFFAASALEPQATYNGGFDNAKDIKLRIGNGGAGQSGLIGELGNKFVQYCVQEKSMSPFLVGWYLGDTTQSIHNLADGLVDIAVTYNEAAEQEALDSGIATQSKYVFRDHFVLVGPPSNPAGLQQNDSILKMFSKIVSTGNADVKTPPANDDLPTRFLSRFDKSATNIKESQLFIQIGQVPWALDYSKWYHQYPQFPLQSLRAAAVLGEYTITDKGTILSSEPDVISQISFYKNGTDCATDPLLNPAHALLGKNLTDSSISNLFMEWVASSTGGQAVIAGFKKNNVVLYSTAPAEGADDCPTTE